MKNTLFLFSKKKSTPPPINEHFSQRENEKAPVRDEPYKGLFRSDGYNILNKSRKVKSVFKSFFKYVFK